MEEVMVNFPGVCESGKTSERKGYLNRFIRWIDIYQKGKRYSGEVTGQSHTAWAESHRWEFYVLKS